MATLTETLERIRALDPALVREYETFSGSFYSFDGVPSDNRYEFREAMIDWLVGQGCRLMSLHNPGCRRWDEMSLDFHGVWQHEDPAQTNCESELHALALCVLKVLENSLDNAPRSPVDER